SSLSLSVEFTSGPGAVFGPSYFTAHASDGGFDGGDLAIGGSNPLPNYAQLSGLLSPASITLFDGSTFSVQSSLLVGPLGTHGGSALGDGPFAEIFAVTGTSCSPVPEPSYRIVFPIFLAA